MHITRNDQMNSHNFFKPHLLPYYMSNFDQTSQEWSLACPLPKLLKSFWLMAIVCHEAPRMVLKCNFQTSTLKPQGQQLSYWYLVASWGSFYNNVLIMKTWPWRWYFCCCFFSSPVTKWQGKLLWSLFVRRPSGVRKLLL